MTREEILQQMRQSIQDKEPIIGVSIGNGRSAKQAENGGTMCFQAHLKPLGFIPGAFIGCSTFFAVGAAISTAVLVPAVLGLLIGLILGYVSELFAKALNSAF